MCPPDAVFCGAVWIGADKTVPNGLVKKLYEGNATGKIPDKHFTRLLNEYDEEQTGLETLWECVEYSARLLF